MAKSTLINFGDIPAEIDPEAKSIIKVGDPREHEVKDDKTGKVNKVYYSDITIDGKSVLFTDPSERFFVSYSKEGNIAFMRFDPEDDKVIDEILAHPSFTTDDPTDKKKMRAKVLKIINSTNKFLDQLDILESHILALTKKKKEGIVRTMVQRFAKKQSKGKKGADEDEDDEKVPIPPIYRLGVPSVRRNCTYDGFIGNCYVKGGNTIKHSDLHPVIFDRQRSKEAKSAPGVPLQQRTEVQLKDGTYKIVVEDLTVKNLNQTLPRFSMVNSINAKMRRVKKGSDLTFKLDISKMLAEPVEYVPNTMDSVTEEDLKDDDDEIAIKAPKPIRATEEEMQETAKPAKDSKDAKKNNKPVKPDSDQEEGDEPEPPKPKKKEKPKQQDSGDDEPAEPKTKTKEKPKQQDSDAEEPEEPKQKQKEKPKPKPELSGDDEPEEPKAAKSKPKPKPKVDLSGDDEPEEPKPSKSKPKAKESDEEKAPAEPAKKDKPAKTKPKVDLSDDDDTGAKPVEAVKSKPAKKVVLGSDDEAPKKRQSGKKPVDDEDT